VDAIAELYESIDIKNSLMQYPAFKLLTKSEKVESDGWILGFGFWNFRLVRVWETLDEKNS